MRDSDFPAENNDSESGLGSESSSKLGDATAEPTKLACEVQKLRRASIKAAETRERLPVPLFWSLFHSQVKNIRSKKTKQRELRNLLLGVTPD